MCFHHPAAAAVELISSSIKPAAAPGSSNCSKSSSSSLRYRSMQIVRWVVSATLVAMATVVGMHAALGFEQNRAPLLMTLWFNTDNTAAAAAAAAHVVPAAAASKTSPATAAATTTTSSTTSAAALSSSSSSVIAVQETKTEATVSSTSCAGRYIYIYDLPELFNTALFQDYCEGRTMWPNMCSALVNKGLGKPIEKPIGKQPISINNNTIAAAAAAGSSSGELGDDSYNYSPKLWYQTDQFALEVMMHERMKVYQCVTKDAASASAFYLPYYGGLDIARHLFTPHVQVRDKLSHKFVGWLLAQPEWRQGGGGTRAHHVLVLGRVVWDFLRKEEADGEWGVPMLHDPELKNMTKLLIERDPYAPSSTMVAIPYPTSFHPETDRDVRAWLQTVRKSGRDVLVSFAGAPRKVQFHGKLRGTLLRQCLDSSAKNCTLLDCSKISCPWNPQFVTGLFLRSVFCLQPPGDSPTRKGIFDCLIAGCIPVFFNNHSAYEQYLWHLPQDGSSYSVFISEDQVQKDGDNVMEIVASISEERVKAMQETILQIIPGLIYAKPENTLLHFKDAFDIIIDHVLGRSASQFPTRQESAGAG